DIVDRKERLVKAMTEATVNGVRGETYFDGTHDTGAALVNSRTKVQKAINRKLDAGGSGIAKSALDAVDSALSLYSASSLAKEWSLGNPISTGLVPFDLEAPAKLLTPRAPTAPHLRRVFMADLSPFVVRCKDGPESGVTPPVEDGI
ncbi:MAG: hypothetical protein WBW80_17015, partial [Acidimicrobiales bacterium]